ncbi:UNVERIFIED_CONTAM: hypothetical protein FKN15_045925 [Acipenser sinensis]
MESRMRRAIPIIRSHVPPICDECGGLNTQVHLRSRRNFSTLVWSGLGESSFISLQAPTKLVPQSDCSCLAGPLMEKNLRNAFMKLEELIDSTTSMWIALVHMQVKSTAHLLLLAWPPLVRLEVTSHGPKTSSPT